MIYYMLFLTKNQVGILKYFQKHNILEIPTKNPLEIQVIFRF